MAGRKKMINDGQVVQLWDGLRHLVCWTGATTFHVRCAPDAWIDNNAGYLIGGIPTCLWCFAR